MKTVRVVAAIIIENDKVFATQRGYVNLKMDGNFPEERLNLARHQKKRL